MVRNEIILYNASKLSIITWLDTNFIANNFLKRINCRQKFRNFIFKPMSNNL